MTFYVILFPGTVSIPETVISLMGGGGIEHISKDFSFYIKFRQNDPPSHTIES
jgi:hypothetical protein